MKKKANINIQIDHRSTEPEHEQIARQIKSQILTHQFTNDLLDVELLSKSLDMSKDQVIKALNMLVKQQMVSVFGDKYELTYREVVDINDEVVHSVSDMIKATHQKFFVKVFDDRYLHADQKLCKEAPFVLGEEIYHHKRIFFGDDYPKAYMEIYFSKQLMPKVDQAPFISMPVYEILSFNQDYVLPFRQELIAIKFDDRINEMLSQSKGTSGFLSKEYYYDEYHQLMIYFQVYFNMNFFVRFKD